MDYQRITDVPAVSDVAGSDSIYVRQGDTFRRISITDFLQALGITDGVSPTIAVSTISGGHRVTITDADGAKTFDVMDGAAGTDGADGDDGADGGYYTPVVTQVISGSMHIAFAPSNDSMPVIPPVEIPLPVGPAGVGLPTATESDDGKIPVVRDGDYVLEAMAGGSAIIADGYCESAAGAVDKYEQGFISSEIVNGSAVCIYFAFDNAAQYPTLQVNGVQGPIFGKNATAINSAALTKGMHLFVYFDRYHAWFMLDSAAPAVAAAVERGLET